MAAWKPFGAIDPEVKRSLLDDDPILGYCYIMTDNREALVRAAMTIMATEKGIREDSRREQHWNILHWRQRENYLAQARSAIEAFKASFGA